MKKRYKLPKGFTLVNADKNIYNKQKQDSAWYTWGDTTEVVRVQYGESFYSVYCCGEMRLEYEGEIMRYADDLESNGITTDKKLSKLTESDDLIWVNNSWFEVVGKDEDWDYNDPFHSVEDAIYSAITCLEDERESVNA